MNSCVRVSSVVEVLSECCLLSYMARVENRLGFLFRLINIINVQTLTQVSFHFLTFKQTNNFVSSQVTLGLADFYHSFYSLYI